MIFRKKPRNSFFWYIFIPFILVVTLFISFSPWLAELAVTPSDKTFTGIHWWSPDYFTYLSYVELGRRGELKARILKTTADQGAVYTHLAYTLSGYFFGKIFQFNSIVSYHLVRILSGLVFLFLSVFFFYRFSKSKLAVFLAFLFAFYISGFVKIIQLSPLKLSRYADYLFATDIIGRITGPIHYTAGYILFVLAICFFFAKINPLSKTIIFAFLLNLLILANPFAYIVIVFTFAFYVIFRLIFWGKRKEFFQKEAKTIFFGFLLSQPLLFYTRSFLSRPPWGEMGTAPGFYRVYHPPISLIEVLFALFPLIFFGILGMGGIIFKKIKVSLTHPQTVFLFSWIISQFFLLVFGDKLRIDPLRSTAGLYYLPLSLFAGLAVISLGKKLSLYFPLKQKLIILIIMGLLVLLTLPNYFVTYRYHLVEFSDLKVFTPFIYPTKKKLEAFYWLEKNTPVGSGVITMYEAGEFLQGFSGNATEYDLDPALRINFFSNQMEKEAAYRFLKEKNFQYVYRGYQEKYYGEGVINLPFLEKVFTNEEVEIYKIL